jgi:hypothetical protein
MEVSLSIEGCTVRRYGFLDEERNLGDGRVGRFDVWMMFDSMKCKKRR